MSTKKESKREVLFYKTWYYFTQSIDQLGIKSLGNEYLIGRYSYLAYLIEKYFIKTKFIHSMRQEIKKRLSIEEIDTLRFLLQAGTKYWRIYNLAIEENWDLEKIKYTIFWKCFNDKR